MAQCVVELFFKKLLEKNDVEDALQKLDRLTQDEARMAVAQTLGVAHGLREGTQHLYDLLISCRVFVVLDSKVSTRLFFLIFPFVAGTDGTSQVTSCKGMSDNGLPLPTHQRIMTSFGKRITQELPHGSLRVMY
jgi:hypothetical protein